jgi:hypothetical protein
MFGNIFFCSLLVYFILYCRYSYASKIYSLRDVTYRFGHSDNDFIVSAFQRSYDVQPIGYLPKRPLSISRDCINFVKTSEILESPCTVPHHCGHVQFSNVTTTWYGLEYSFCFGHSECSPVCDGTKCRFCQENRPVVYSLTRLNPTTYPIFDNKFKEFSADTLEPYLSNFNFDYTRILSRLAYVNSTNRHCFYSKDITRLPYFSFDGKLKNSIPALDVQDLTKLQKVCYQHFDIDSIERIRTPFYCAYSLRALILKLGILISGVPHNNFTLETRKASSSCEINLGSTYGSSALKDFPKPQSHCFPNLLPTQNCIKLHAQYSFLAPFRNIFNLIGDFINSLLFKLLHSLEDLFYHIFKLVLKILFDLVEYLTEIGVEFYLIETVVMFTIIFVSNENIYLALYLAILFFIIINSVMNNF